MPLIKKTKSSKATGASSAKAEKMYAKAEELSKTKTTGKQIFEMAKKEGRKAMTPSQKAGILTRKADSLTKKTGGIQKAYRFK